MDYNLDDTQMQWKRACVKFFEDTKSRAVKKLDRNTEA